MKKGGRGAVQYLELRGCVVVVVGALCLSTFGTLAVFDFWINLHMRRFMSLSGGCDATLRVNNGDKNKSSCTFHAVGVGRS